jgi:hypothetical protein
VNGTNNLAIVSLVSGAASWLGLPLIAAFVAIVCGHMALGQIRDSGEDGEGYAKIGLVLGYLNVALSCAGIIVAVMFFGAIMSFLGLAAAAGG